MVNWRKFRWNLLAPVLLLSIASSAHARPRPAPNAGRASATIRGIVRTPDGQGIPDAQIYFANRSNDTDVGTALTDANGQFRVDAVAGSEYFLRVTKQGFVIDDRVRVQTEVENLVIVLAGDEHAPPLVFPMVPQAVLSGRVHDEYGDPLAGMVVCVFRADREGASLRLARLARERTDDRGIYRAAGLTSGRYYVEACPYHPPFQAVTDEKTFVATFYPGEVEFSRATPIDLETGAERLDIDIAMSRQNVFHLKGTVVDESGEPMTFAEVHAIPSGPNYDGVIPSRWFLGSVIRTQENGAFDFDSLAAGTYQILGMGYGEPRSCIGCPVGPGEAVAYGTATVTIGGSDIENLRLQLRAPRTLSGVVRLTTDEVGLADPEPVPNVSIAFQFDHYSTRDPATLFREFETQSGPDGAFTFPNAWRTEFYVSVSDLPSGMYLKSLTYGDQNLLNSRLDHTNPSDDAAVEVVLSEGSAEISGVARGPDGSSAAGAHVFAWPIGSTRPDGFVGKTTGSDGRFKIGNLEPGDYFLLATQAADIQLIRDPAFRKAISNGAIRLALEAFSHKGDVDVPVVGEQQVLEAARTRP